MRQCWKHRWQMLMTGKDWGSDEEIEGKRVNKERQGRWRRIKSSHTGCDEETEEAATDGEEGGKAELLCHVKWKMGDGELRGFMIQHACFYKGAVLPSTLPPMPLTFKLNLS